MRPCCYHLPSWQVRNHTGARRPAARMAAGQSAPARDRLGRRSHFAQAGRARQICQKARGRPRPQKQPLRLTPLHHRSHWSATSTPPKRPQTNHSHPQSLRPGWPRSNLPRRATVSVAGATSPKLAARDKSVRRRAGVHARRNNAARNTPISPFPLVCHFHTPKKTSNQSQSPAVTAAKMAARQSTPAHDRLGRRSHFAQAGRTRQICPKARGRPRPQKQPLRLTPLHHRSHWSATSTPQKDPKPITVTRSHCGQDGRAPIYPGARPSRSQKTCSQDGRAPLHNNSCIATPAGCLGEVSLSILSS